LLIAEDDAMAIHHLKKAGETPETQSAGAQ
jgi:hypothetical protein